MQTTSIVKTLQELSNDNRFKISLTLVLTVILTVPFLFFDYQTVQNYIASHRISGIFVALILYVVIGLFLVPTDGLTIFILATMGFGVAFVLDIIGNSLVSYIEYFIGTGLQDLTEFEKKNKKLPGFLETYPIAKPLYQILGRMLPAFGSKVINILCGFRRTSLKVFTLTTLYSTTQGAFMVTIGFYWAAAFLIRTDLFGLASNFNFLQIFISQYPY